MALSDYADSVQEITRYGVDYEVSVFERGVRGVAPVGECQMPDDAILLAGIESMQRIGCVNEDLPNEFGYDTVRRHHPLWPKSGSSHIYHHPGRDEYLKMPVEVKGGGLQFFAMNGIARALGDEAQLQVVRFRTLLTCSGTRSSAAFMEAAHGTRARQIVIRLQDRESNDEAEEFMRQVRNRLAQMMAEEVPVWLRPLLNDNPRNHPALGVGNGYQNLFLDGESNQSGIIDPETATFTLIDQAHPTPFSLGYHAVVRYFRPSQLRGEELHLQETSGADAGK